MKKNKKLMTVLALNSLAMAAGAAQSETKQIKQGQMYSQITKKMETGKSIKSDYELIEKILNKKNKELKDLYLQGDYIIKPEYLEWQIFFTGFYESQGNGKGNKEVIMPFYREPKTISLGMYIPVRSMPEFALSPEIETKNLNILSISDPQNIEARDVEMFSIDVPQIDIDITPPSFNITPQVIDEQDINLITNLEAPHVPLEDIKIFNLKLDQPTNPLFTNGTITNQTLSSASANDIILKVTSTGVNTIAGNGITEKAKSSAVLLESGLATVSQTGGNIILRNSETSGLAISPNNTVTAYNANTGDYKAENHGNITGEQAASGVYTKQIGMGYIPSGAKNIQVNMLNSTTGVITMRSPNSAGFLLMPDEDQDPGGDAANDYSAYLVGGRVAYDGGLAYADMASYDQRNVRQIAINDGTINVYGSRSYGFLTSPYEGSQLEHNFGISTRYENTSRIENTGTINVMGDEATGFAIKKGLQFWLNTGTINIGDSSQSTQNNTNGNTIYTETGTADNSNPSISAVGDITKVERATGMYTNQDMVLYTSDISSTGPPAVFGQNLQSSAENSATINIWKNATESSGLRAESSGYVMNRGSINIYGDNNYGIVSRDAEDLQNGQIGGRVYNIIYTSFNPGVYNSVTGQWEVAGISGKEAHINVNSKGSAGAYVDRGGYIYNTGYIEVSDSNSTGFYVKSGTAVNEDRTNDPVNHSYGKTITTGQNSHGVLVTNEDSTGAKFENKGLIQTNTEGTVGIYAVNSSTILHAQSEDKETHFVEDSNSPGYSITTAQWIANGGVIGTDGYSEAYGYVTLTTDYKQNALIKAGDGGTGLWLEQKNNTFSPSSSVSGITNALVSAPIEVGNSTANYSAIGVYSDGIATAKFTAGSVYNLDPVKYSKDVAGIKVGTGGVALLQNYKNNAAEANSRKRFGSSSGVFEIEALNADLGNDSILAYSNGGDILTSDLSNVNFTNIGNNATFAFSSNNGSITVDNLHLSDFLLNPGSVFTGTGITPYVAENGEVKNTITGSNVGTSGIAGLVLNTKMGLQSYSKNNTSVTADKKNTKTTNDGLLTMIENTSGVVGAYTKYGTLENTVNGVITTNETASIAMYGIDDSDIINNGIMNTSGNNSIGIYALSNDTTSPVAAAGGINAANNGTINVSGNTSAGIYAEKNSTTAVNNKISNSGTINVNSGSSAGIYADNVNITNTGTINIGDTAISTDGGRIAVYGKGADTKITTTGANINLGQIDQSQVAYYIADGAELTGSNLGTVYGNGILILSDNSTVGSGISGITAGDGQIALALKGNNTINYTGEIKTGNTVNTGSNKFYSIALYADTQNIASLSNKLTAGTSGIGLYAGGGSGTTGTGSNITYNGEIETGTSGIGIYVKAGSNVNLASGGSIKINDLGVGAYVEGNGEFTFGTGSSMTFTDSGIGIWGEDGSIINDDGTGIINSLSATGSVIRSRVANGVINITGPATTVGNGVAGFVSNGEVNNLAGSTITSSAGTVGTTGIAAEGYKSVGSNAYEANNFGTINLQNTDKGTGIYAKNARAYNGGNAEIILGSNGVGMYAESDSSTEPAEIKNAGNVKMLGSKSIGLYGNGASLIENSGVLSSDIEGNIGIYSKGSTVSTINNSNSIMLSNSGIGIYAENAAISNTGSITTGDKTAVSDSIGIYAKNSVVTNTGDVKTGQDGIAFFGDNSTININGGNIDVSKGSLVYGKNGSIINYNTGDTVVSGVQPYINIENSALNFSSPAALTVSDNGTGILVSGNTGTVTGNLELNLNNNAVGTYIKDLGTVYTNNAKINVNGTGSNGIASENSSIVNNGQISVNGEKSTGLFSQLTKAGNITIENADKINVNSENGIGIYALTEDNTGTSLGSAVIDNNGIIALGNSTDINTKAQIGIYGTKGAAINNNSSITGGANVVGIYSTGSEVTSDGEISLGDSSIGIYLNNSNLTTGTSAKISAGENGSVGIYAANGSNVVNSSNNITAGKNSILMYAKDNGTVITNKGDLSVEENSIAFYVNGGKIDNQGAVKANGANAVFIYGTAGEIQNSNVLDADGNTGTVGFYGKNTNIQNTGDILTGNSVIVSSVSAENTYSVGIYGENSSVSNAGKITLGTDGVGIYVKDTPTTAVNTGVIESSKDGAIGIFADNGTIQNLGTIILSGNDSIGMAGRSGSTLINDGNIIINGNNGIGMYVTAGSYVYNNNTITINGNDGVGIQIGGGSYLENRGTINLNGTKGVDVAHGEGTSYKLPSIINAGIINVEEKFELNGVDVSVKVDPSTVRTPTAEEITASGYDASDLAGGFLISNAVKFNAPSFDFDKPVNIMSTFSEGTNATVYKLENVFNSSIAATGVNEVSVISDSLTWDAIPAVSNKGGIDVWMQKLDYTSFAKNHWYNEFAGVLDNEYKDATGNALKIYDKIDKIKTVEEFDHVMNSLAGNVYANMNQRENDIAEVFENSLHLLQNSENNTKENVKINVIAGKGKNKEETSGVTGYDYTTTGVLALREVERTYKHTLGYSLGYLHTGFEFEDGNSSEEWVDTIQLGVHNKYKTNGWELKNDLTGRAGIHNIDRNIDWASSSGRSEMNGTYETYSITSDNILGKEFSLGKKASITPYGGVRAMYATRPTFNEDGVESLKVEGNDAWSVKPRAGVELKGEVPLGSSESWKVKGALDIAYEYELGDLDERESAKLTAVETDYHKLVKPEKSEGQIRTKAMIGVEAKDRYGIFLTGDYKVSNDNQDDYRVGVTLKAVF